MGKLKTLAALIATGLILAPASFAETAARKTTAQNQSMASADVDLTRRIRQDVMKLNVSTEAKNITIVTNSGRVTLSGQVANADEKSAVINAARALAADVTDQINVRQ